MEREIKFKFYPKKGYGNEPFIKTINECRLPSNTTTAFNVMQFTGLTDKNSVEIYEGDIVKCYIDDEPIGALDTVSFKDGAFILRTRTVTMHEWRTMPNDEYGSELEVIGNIYENGNLL